MINSILYDLETTKIAITSIGLDGEEIDQVTYLEKPRVYVSKGYIVATARDTLKAFEAEYETLIETDIFTPIGDLVIVKIKKAGNALIAGPSVIFDMEKTLKLLDEFVLDKIFIDGAFFRHSLAKISEATILVVGANLHQEMDRVVLDAELTFRKFNLKEPPQNVDFLVGKSHIHLVDEQGKFIDLGFDSVIGNTVKIFNWKNKNYRFLYLPKAFTNDFLEKLVEFRREFHFDIILDSPTNIQLNLLNLNNLFKLENQIYILKPTNLVAVCYNPCSSRGYKFDDLIFKKKLEHVLGQEVFNVKEGNPNE